MLSFPAEMKASKLMRVGALLLMMILSGRAVLAQVILSGTVYDQSQRYPMRGVSIMSSSGKGTMTDSAGHYTLKVGLDDSVSFSYLGRLTAEFPVRDIPTDYPFNMSIQVIVDTLPQVLVKSPNYRFDSTQNRLEYAKAFDYSPSWLRNMKMGNRPGLGVGFDLDMLLNPRYNREMEALQSRLEYEEQDKYVDHRWNPALVKRLTGLEPPLLDSFMRIYRPSYSFVQSCETEYQFFKYVQQWADYFRQDWKEAHKGEADKPAPVVGAGH
jgi:hypothetical protein